MTEHRGRLARALAWTRHAITPSDVAWTAAARALFVLWLAVLVWLAVTGVLPQFSVEKVAGFISTFAALGLISGGVLLVLWLLRLLAPRYRGALFVALPPIALMMLGAWGTGMFAGAAILLIGLSLFFGAGASLLRARSGITLAYFVLGVLLIGGAIYALMIAPPADQNPALAHYRLKGTTLAMPDPSKPGLYAVETFTYGSGTDRHRPEYAQGVRFKTHSFDGAKLDKNWTGFGGWLRTQYWGFDSAHMPVQGRVWMPKGKGPFPLALVVHGNHVMEDFSDPGYAYLGELLASQGIIFVSVDENFLNSSLADTADPFHMRGGDETKARAWMLLQNVAQWRRWSRDPKSPLAGKIDMDRVALLGHSRGGEAVAVANAFNTLSHFPDDATVPFDFHFHLRGILAIAPVDGQYSPRSRPTPMADQNYFVIHGSMDGDVRSFMGSSQYSRETFSGKTDAFKANLYVAGANHGQFNTSWGRNDMGAMFGLLLDERPIMNPDEQRQIAKVYFSAFLQMTLQDKDGYRPLFEDARNGAAWLPNIFFLNNYADSRTMVLAGYDEDLDTATSALPGVAIAGSNLSAWREDYADLKWNAIGTQVALLAWDDRVHAKGAAYAFTFAAPPVADAGTAFVFSASQSDIDTLPKDFKPKDKDKADDKRDKPLDWTIVVVDANGQKARLPLSHNQVLYPQIKGETRRAGFLDSEQPSELVMRRYRFVLGDFVKANPKLDLAAIKQIRFEFDRSKRGAIALDDVGLAPAR